MGFEDIMKKVGILLEPLKPLTEGQIRELQDHINRLKPFVTEKSKDREYLKKKQNIYHLNRVKKAILLSEMILESYAKRK